MNKAVTEREREILRQALGLSRSKQMYRNYFAANGESHDYNDCRKLVRKGLMEESHTSDALVYFHVTELGKSLFEPHAPGLTKYWTWKQTVLEMKHWPKYPLSARHKEPIPVYLASEVEAHDAAQRERLATVERRYADQCAGTMSRMQDNQSLTQQLASMGQERDLLNRENHKLREQVETLELERDKWKRWAIHRVPTHGTCCTCQRCGLDHDSCRCNLDEVCDELDKLKTDYADLTAKLSAMEAGEPNLETDADKYRDWGH